MVALSRQSKSLSGASGSKKSILLVVMGIAIGMALSSLRQDSNAWVEQMSQSSVALLGTSVNGGQEKTVESSLRSGEDERRMGTNNAPASTSDELLTSWSVSTERDFFKIAEGYGTDKVRGYKNLPKCLEDESKCDRPEAPERQCKVTGHFYNTMYQRWLGPYSNDNVEPFQFLEIGYFNGNGFDSYTDFLPNAEKHSMEISCLPEGPRSEGKWPWGNFARHNRNYQSLLDARRLHCGDASDFDFLHKIYSTEMQRPDGTAPALKVVIDDGSHVSEHMAMSLFFWFPRIAPGGILVIEDIEPMSEASVFRRQIMPQVHHDVHYCGLKEYGYGGKGEPAPCFPTIQPLLKSIHCEMHICVFERNDVPASDPPKEQSTIPPGAFDAKKCLFESK